jgi:dTMP kinase
VFIAFEGIEGAGKSTVLERMAAALRGRGLPVLVTREPGGTAFGRGLRTMLLDARGPHCSPQAELLLFLADRAQHVREVLLPALAGGSVVLCDRYADSTLAYQGHGRGLPLDRLLSLNEFATGGLWPDLTLLFDLPPRVGLARAEKRNLKDGTDLIEGRFDAERLNFHERVREGYLRLAETFPERYALVDASGTEDEVLRAALAPALERLALFHPRTDSVSG